MKKYDICSVPSQIRPQSHENCLRQWGLRLRFICFSTDSAVNALSCSEQLKRLYKTMTGYMKPYDFSDEMISGLTADFDRLFELSWKTLTIVPHKFSTYTSMVVRGIL